MNVAFSNVPLSNLLSSWFYLTPLIAMILGWFNFERALTSDINVLLDLERSFDFKTFKAAFSWVFES